ncbi:1,6-anhydro-N-acetylmuramyl-L-alanine amidase AmpD [Oligella ureolytica]|uniref:1,6-anhydro-N-acetylmuramyl-L-alanine amidase AmpD n=1 Tax=Oligella ureolytica TaxID=90244 RepID=A0A378XEE0_9BURK|nr:1,6-anhydro-N-acetylmuramyl-L-alanine amidase AmpD [Oligella ureolytica]QPT41021.1 1,6-anhydro-N-acetylmuramyl-L-alanine amidase AmpD [Oligella ureolytica]SUA53462.1 1,6-anhydro-N-acetylmuramyl-L-alanine amidase AmpD [Oligella ureolytica]
MKLSSDTKKKTPTLKIDRHGWLRQYTGYISSGFNLPTAVPARQTRTRSPNQSKPVLLKHVMSPNYSGRPKGIKPSLLVIHYISLPPDQFGGPYIEQLFTNHLNPTQHPFFEEIKDLRVSAHFLIRRNGQIIQFVSTEKMAFHAGKSDFIGRGPCNPYSIGIELEGNSTTAFEEIQYERLALLTLALKRRYGLTAVRGHEHIAPGRKQDPGPYFNWQYYGKSAGWLKRQQP